MCTLKKCLWLHLFVSVVKLCTCNVSNDVQPVTEHLFHWTSTDINIKIRLMLVQKLWLVNWASQNMALAGPTAVWVASGHREARPLER